MRTADNAPTPGGANNSPPSERLIWPALRVFHRVGASAGALHCAWISGLAFCLAINGALPLITVPAAEQAVWTMGFAESFAHGSLLQFRADHFGLPEPAPMSFGLAGSWPASLFLRLGVPAATAYTLMVAMWLSVAYWAAYRVARITGSDRWTATLASMTWLTMPVIWVHANYSMLSLGIALLPLYFLPLLAACSATFDRRHLWTRFVPASVGTATIAAFMDGYTFMMLATGGCIFTLTVLISRREVRRFVARRVLPVHLGAIAVGYTLYTNYMNGPAIPTEDLGFFRAFSLDLSYLIIPSTGVHWLPDALGFHLGRSTSTQFGDGSVWSTTFALPLLVAGLVAWWQSRIRHEFSNATLLVAAVAFYLALGPSLKVFAEHSSDRRGPLDSVTSMPAGEALFPTGSGVVSAQFPGFESMRAPYRWFVLCAFALWLLCVIRASFGSRRARAAWMGALCLVLVVNLPHIDRKLDNGRENRASLQRIDRELIPEARSRIQPGETAAFVPWYNDFLVNYLAPRADFRTLNVGGDKNGYIARTAWPEPMVSLYGPLRPESADTIDRLLRESAVDVVVIPYFSPYIAAYYWPCGALAAGRTCLSERRVEVQGVIRRLIDNPGLTVEESELFVTIRLRPPSTARGGAAPAQEVR